MRPECQGMMGGQGKEVNLHCLNVRGCTQSFKVERSCSPHAWLVCPQEMTCCAEVSFGHACRLQGNVFEPFVMPVCSLGVCCPAMD